ncbi:hypothetical protein EJ03DRAFT_370564 [Teratosphaeria nubilosa]|uniref:Uncharacterized protein n=1 Tax=Teratosphaeria nubilosa TaxID=161662 RepID=A0A6G1LNE2_9PEZI|nr:hypothetical protein EJ03DRAFT_370564 [Teratosphaeria nubilosa]
MEVKHPLMLVNKQVSQEFSGILDHHLREHADLTITVLNFDFDAISKFLDPLFVANLQCNRNLTITLHVTSTQWLEHVQKIKSWNLWLSVCGSGLVVDYSLHPDINWYACWKSLTRVTGAIKDVKHHQPIRQAILDGLESHKQESREIYADMAEFYRMREEAGLLGKQLEAWDGESEAPDSRGVDGDPAIRGARQLELKRVELKGRLEKAEKMARTWEERIAMRMGL